MRLLKEGYRIRLGDCLEVMQEIEPGSVDLVLADLPYGTTAQKWDSVIPLPELWAAYDRVLSPQGVVCLTAANPFTAQLIVSAIPALPYRYGWVWVKNKAGGFAQAKNKPMPSHEDVLIFARGATGHASQCKNRMPYYPQGLQPFNKVVKNRGSDRPSAFEARANRKSEYMQEFTNYPTSILNFDVERTGLHATQKPVALGEYLINTYTLPGALVLDNTTGSASFGVAALNTGRRFIGIEKTPEIYAIARDRLKQVANARKLQYSEDRKPTTKD